jgi:hypothetical protein
MLSAFDGQLLLPIACISALTGFLQDMKYLEIGAEDPLISYDKKEKNPQSESRRYWSE